MIAARQLFLIIYRKSDIKSIKLYMLDKIGGFFEKTDLELDIKNKKKEIQKLKGILGEVMYEQALDQCKIICPEIIDEILKYENEIVEIRNKIASVASEAICEKCKKPITKDSKFCNYCGSPVALTKLDIQDVCPSCGKTVNCGVSLKRSDIVVEKEIRKCTNCGADLDDDAVFCMSCGMKI